MAADRTPNELADALDVDADWHHTWAQFIAAHDDGSTTDSDAFALHDAMSKRARAAAEALRRQGEHLDTLRNAPGPLRTAAVSVARDGNLSSADAERWITWFGRLDDALAAAGGGVPEPMDEGDRVCSACSGSGVRHPASNPEACKVCAGSGVLDGGVPKKGATDE